MFTWCLSLSIYSILFLSEVCPGAFVFTFFATQRLISNSTKQFQRLRYSSLCSWKPVDSFLHRVFSSSLDLFLYILVSHYCSAFCNTDIKCFSVHDDSFRQVKDKLMDSPWKISRARNSSQRIALSECHKKGSSMM